LSNPFHLFELPPQLLGARQGRFDILPAGLLPIQRVFRFSQPIAQLVEPLRNGNLAGQGVFRHAALQYLVAPLHFEPQLLLLHFAERIAKLGRRRGLASSHIADRSLHVLFELGQLLQ